MSFEALPQLSQLRASVVRRALGAGWREALFVDVAVLSEEGGLPFVGRVELDLVRRGLGLHLGLVCPQCHLPREVLRLDGDGHLRCQFRCFKRLTRQQQQKSHAEWDRGDRAIDQVVRMLQKRTLTEAGYQRALGLADELAEADIARCLSLEAKIDAVMKLAADHLGLSEAASLERLSALSASDGEQQEETS